MDRSQVLIALTAIAVAAARQLVWEGSLNVWTSTTGTMSLAVVLLLVAVVATTFALRIAGVPTLGHCLRTYYMRTYHTASPESKEGRPPPPAAGAPGAPGAPAAGADADGDDAAHTPAHNAEEMARLAEQVRSLFGEVSRAATPEQRAELEESLRRVLRARQENCAEATYGAPAAGAAAGGAPAGAAEEADPAPAQPAEAEDEASVADAQGTDPTAEAGLKLSGSLYAARGAGAKGRDGGRKGKKGHGHGTRALRERSAELKFAQHGGRRRLQAEGLDAVADTLARIHTELRPDDGPFRLHLQHLKEMQDLGSLLGVPEKDHANLELLMPELTPRWYEEGGSFEQLYDWFASAEGSLPRFLALCEQQVRQRGFGQQQAAGPRCALANVARWRALMLDDVVDGCIADFRRRAPAALLFDCGDAEAVGQWERQPERRNGYPKWARGDLRLYSDRHGLWMLGCSEEEEEERGFVASKHPHAGVPPNEVDEWQVFTDGEWRDDARVKATVHPSAAAAHSQLGPTRTELHRAAA